MLKIFLSSTSRDLKEFREVLLAEIGKALDGVGMEFFVPRGEGSQKDSINYLKRCQVVIFLITPYYGSLMEDCTLKESCKAAECPMKTGEGQISFTHCEYKTTIAEDIRHQTYLVEKDWNLIDYLKVIPKNEFNVEKMKNLEIFKGIPPLLIEKYYKVSKFADALRVEVSNEAYGRIEQIKIPETLDRVKKNLADAIIEWHTQDKLNFTQFCDREKVFNELIENIDSKVEVWGVGGVGKTALIELALLIQKLKGKRILTIGTSKAYASGSGLEDFRTKCKDEQYIADSRNEITIYDVINAFAENKFLPDAEEVNKMPKEEKIAILSNIIRSEENLILFIDDFHLANDDVVEVAKSVDHIILSSRKNTHIARTEIYLSGIDEEDREDLIKLFSTEIPENVRKSINQIAEGHPVSTELLVKNYQYIDFDKIKDFNLEDANDEQVKDFYKRVIEEIFSTNIQALILLKDLATLNTDLSTNINRESVLNAYDIEGIRKVFKNLVDTGMVKKSSGSEGIYEFYFKHIQDYLEDEAEKDCHEKAIKYYEKKKEIIGENVNDAVEVLYHKVKSNPSEELVDEFLEIKKKVQPVHYGFRRLIDVGEELKTLVEEKNKASIIRALGTLYHDLGRFEEAEHAYNEVLDIYKELADKNPDDYLHGIAITKISLGNLYLNLKRFAEAETAYNEALEIRKDLAGKN
ncbi:MAG: tetratricopeptide repeat protein, partial [Promethearchaeia archaeon]